MALTPFEEKLVSNYMDATYPQPEPEPAPEQASMDGVQLAAGPSPVVSDAGAAFGVYPGMGKRSQRSDIGERMITGAPDFAAGAARGATTAALGLGGDIQTLGRFIAALATDDQGGGIMDKLGRAAQTMSLPTFLPTSENLSKGGYTIPGTSITLPGLPSAVPAGQGGFGMTPEQRQSAADVGQLAGELVGDPVMFAKAGQVAAKAVKATKGMPVGMSTQAVGGMDNVLTPTAKAAAPVNDMGFYSAVEQAALNIQRKSGTGQAMLNDITKGENVKADEVKWIGLDDFLKGKKNVTREEVQQFIAANKVDVQEVTLGEQGVMEARQMAVDDITETLKAGDMFDDDAQWALKTWQESQPGSRLENQARVLLEEKLIYAGENRTVADFLDAGAAQTDSTKFGAYTLPGGENYREILLTLPENFGAKPNKDGYTPLSAITDAQYKSSHWEQPNVLAHIRVNDRVDADGKKMLLVEEVQSDWHQAGRDKGYKSDVNPEENKALVKQWDTLANERRDLERIVATGDDADPAVQSAVQRLGEISNELNAVNDRLTQVRTTFREGVPDAPMKDTWYQLALKRVLKYAADNGYERVGLTTGKTNAERFDLSKQVDSLLYSKNDDGTYKVSAQIQGRGQMLGESIPEAKLADYVGKEVAENMAKGVGNRTEVAGNYDPVSMTQGPRKYMTELSGDGLKVGGEGMKKYYDEVYPQFLSKYGKKWGAKVGETRIETEQSPKSWAYFRDWFAANHSDVGGSSTALAQWESGEKSKYVREFLKQNKAQEPVRFVDITPEMRQGVGKGQPLFTATGIGAGTTGATMQDKEQK